MTVVELREKLIAKINDIDNEAVLEYLSIAIDFEKDNEEIHIMSPGAQAAVEEGLAQLDRGEWITNEEANKRADEWLKK